MSRTKIDSLVEKYLTTYEIYGEQIELWVNPSKQEMRKIGRELRFIADSKTKKIYFADADVALHNYMFAAIQKETNDYSRSSVYKGTLMPGEFWFHKEVHLDSVNIMSEIEMRKWAKIDWSWVGKYMPGFDKAYKEFVSDTNFKEFVKE